MNIGTSKIEDITPINGNIIVIDNKIKEITKGGIYIPNSVPPDSLIIGTVVGTSTIVTKKGVKREPDLKPGDQVYYKFTAGAGNAWNADDGATVRMVQESEIFARINDDEETVKEQDS